MYKFQTEAQKAAFLSALDSGVEQHMQHIRGRLTDVTGAVTVLGDDNLVDSPSFDSRCLENEEVFNFAEMYVGELSMRLKNSDIRAAVLRGGEIRLEFGIDTELGEIWIPLGVWDISSAERESEHFISIKGIDHIGRLAAPVGISEVGAIQLSTIMQKVEEIAGIEFAQTADEILAMKVSGTSYMCTHFEETCWEEVRQIAQIIGGFAFANREGKIEFRRFGWSAETGYAPVLTIKAERRFRASLSEDSFGIKGISYTDGNEKQWATYSTIHHDTSSVLCFPKNKYIYDMDGSRAKEYYEGIITEVRDRLVLLNYTPGTVDFYGDPALDLGDMVELTGGVGGKSVNFLICSSFWQFRGPQTITAGGAPEIGEYVSSGSSSGGSGAAAIPVQGSITKNVNVSALKGYTGALFPTERTVARTRFSCKETVNAFLECTLVIMGTEAASVQAAVYLDGEKQDISPKTAVRRGRYTTLAFSLAMPVRSGMHTVAIMASGVSELTEISGCVWGQNISPEELTYSEDYTYILDGGQAAVTGYTGSEEHIEIPEKLGGGDVASISGAAFTYSPIQSAYIPDGVTAVNDGGGEAVIQEASGALPLSFRSNGNDLLDWRITGAEGGIGKPGVNYLKMEEKTVSDGGGGTVMYSYAPTVSFVPVPPEAPYTSEYQQWVMGEFSRHIEGFRDTLIDDRVPCYDTCFWFAELKAGKYKLIMETYNPYGHGFYGGCLLPTGKYPFASLFKPGADEPFFTIQLLSENKSDYFIHEEYLFTVDEEMRVGFFGLFPDFSRFMIVDEDVEAQPFSVPYSSVSGVTCWEPFHYELPLTITCGGKSETITIDLGQNPLGAGESISLADTGITIPTYSGKNTIDAESDIKPSEMYVKFEDDSAGAFMYAENLEYVSIPESVKYIGEWAFTYTVLRSVRIAKDCEYYPTSFPEGCGIWFYGDEPEPDDTDKRIHKAELEIEALKQRISVLENQ